MSDDTQPENTGTEDTPEAEFDITTADEATLRDRAADLKGQIESLESQPRTLANANAILALRSERNEVVGAVNTLIQSAADPAEDATIATPEASDDTPDGDGDAEDGESTTPAEEAAPAPEAPTPEEAPVSDDTPTSDTTGGEVVDMAASEADAQVEAAESVLAEARVASAEGRPTAPAGPAYTRPRTAYVAGAGQTAFTQGKELDGSSLARAWDSIRTGLKPGPNGPTRAVVAELPSFDETQDMPIESLSRNNGVERNDALIDESVTAWRDARKGMAPASAHVAAICDPLDIIREIPYGGETDTPFGDSFPQRPISRLGFQFTRASAMSVAASGVSLWTESDQDSVDEGDSGTWKPTVLIECSDPTEIKAEELVTSAVVDTATEMSSPERVGEFMHKLAVARSRRREQYLLDLFDATASPYTLTGTFGAMASLTQAVHTVLPQLLYGERLDESEYDLVLDPGFYNKLVIDEAVKCELTAEEVRAKIQREIGLNLVVLRDFETARATGEFQTPPTPGGSASALTDLPSENRVRISPAGAYIYGSTGQQSTGWQTDPQLARQNRMQAFSAEWLLLAKHGEAPAAIIDITSDANGARGGCVTPA